MNDRELQEVRAQIEALKSRLQHLKHEDRSRTRAHSRWVSLSDRSARVLLVTLVCAVPFAAYAAYIAVPNTFVNGTIADAGEVNANFATLVNESNDQDARLGSVETDTTALEADVAAIQASLVPGTVMLFDLSACPSGWSLLTGAAGRAIVGGGSVGSTVGAALSNLEDRTHAHSVNPPVADTASGSLAHTHGVDPPATVASATGQHNHAWSTFDLYTGLVWRSFTAAGGNATIINWSDGIGDDGFGYFPLARDTPGSVSYFTDNEDNHDHTLDIPSFYSEWDSAPHDHSFDLAATASGTASTSDTLPYVQLLVCRMN